MPHPAGRLIDLDDSITNSEAIASQLQEISKTMKKLLGGRLTEEGIIVLIRATLPKGSKLKDSQIREVLQAAANLGRYVNDGRKKEETHG